MPRVRPRPTTELQVTGQRSGPRLGPSARASLIPSAPTPTLPLGAGGPLRRAAGRAEPRPIALIVEPDELLRLQVGEAVRGLGLDAAEAGTGRGREPAVLLPVVAVFVGLDRPAACASLCAAADRPGGAVARLPRVGYAARFPRLLGAHRLHRCCDVLLELRAQADGPRFSYFAPGSQVERSGLSSREADVLLLLCAGLPTADVAARLFISPATARSHCRSVLRKLGARNRSVLRAQLLGPGA